MRIMAKRGRLVKSKCVFDCDSDNDDSSEGKFQEYITKRVVSTKSISQKAELQYSMEDDKQVEERSEEVPRRSKFMQKFLESKQQKKVDKLEAESLRININKQLENDQINEKESFVSESYKVKKSIMNKAVLVSTEDNQGQVCTESFMIAKQILKEDSDCEQENVERTKEVEIVDTKSGGKIENDIYVCENVGNRSWSKSKEIVSVCKESVEEFLKSRVSDIEIRKHREEYFVRKKVWGREVETRDS